MTDVVVSVFQFSNSRNLMVPEIAYQYLERDTGVRWHITTGGSRSYLIRYGEGLAKNEEASIKSQNAIIHVLASTTG